MTDLFDRRGFVPLPPPPGGMSRALRDGRRLRLRRRIVGTSVAAAVMAVAAGTFAATASSGPGATDQLIPAVAPQTTPTAAPAAGLRDRGATAGVRPSATPAGRAAAGTATLGARTTGSSSSTTRPSAGPTEAPAAPASSYRAPNLLRSYRPPAPSQGPNPSICSGAFSGGRSGVDAASNWCFRAQVTPTARGHDLSVQVCRDSAGAGQLHFSRRLEVDLVVTAGTGTQSVWRWSTGHPDAAQAHVLDVAAEACWTWTAPWTDVDRDGDALPSGDYTLSVSAQAPELRAFSAPRVTFSIS